MRRLGWIIAGIAIVLVGWEMFSHRPQRTAGIPAILMSRGITIKAVPTAPSRISIQEALVDSQTAHGNILLTPATTPTAQMVSITPGHQRAWLVTLHGVTVLHLRSHHQQTVSTVVVLINANNGSWMRWTPVHG